MPPAALALYEIEETTTTTTTVVRARYVRPLLPPPPVPVETTGVLLSEHVAPVVSLASWRRERTGLRGDIAARRAAGLPVVAEDVERVLVRLYGLTPDEARSEAADLVAGVAS
jgi:hypothetical protein